MGSPAAAGPYDLSEPLMSLVFFGRSHLTCIDDAFVLGAVPDAPECRFFYLQDFAERKRQRPPDPMQSMLDGGLVDNYNLSGIRRIISGKPVDMVVCPSTATSISRLPS